MVSITTKPLYIENSLGEVYTNPLAVLGLLNLKIEDRSSLKKDIGGTETETLRPLSDGTRVTTDEYTPPSFLTAKEPFRKKCSIEKKLSIEYQIGARSFDPMLGIWLTPDPAGEFSNPFGRSGDPVNYVDPDGNCEILCFIAIGAALYGAYKGYQGGGAEAFANGSFLEGTFYLAGGAAVGVASVYGGAAVGAVVAPLIAGPVGAAALAAGASQTVAGVTAAVASGAVAGAAGAAVGHTIGYAGNSALGIEQNASWGNYGRGLLYGTLTGAVTGGLVSGGAYGVSSSYREGIHKTIAHYQAVNAPPVSASPNVQSPEKQYRIEKSSIKPKPARSDKISIRNEGATRYPTGRRGNPINVPQGTNSSTSINGRHYTGHSLDQMQGRGVPVSAVETTIAEGSISAGNTPNTTVHKFFNLKVITNNMGDVITVILQ